ncbi:hypothetical protein L6164_009368 [Bauhinia variegata]|uniref:Uncharacterized protein n=1 Tax=Bauhinia variegata TaxID=167791 RepID=A0ACB9PIQ7_BAUVA|nr:hypothetical protein L6164_009368 [Bauhinia variegata]
MENGSRSRLHDLTMASRKAEEAVWRRYQAAQWLETEVGPLGISSKPSEREFISCLRNGLHLCNAINKIHPGAVPRVVDNQVLSQSLARDSQPLPAYQYFENVRNFLVAVEELKLPAVEASDLDRDNLEAGSAAKVVDCILGLKLNQEWKQTNNKNGFNKHIKSPLVTRSASRMLPRASAGFSLDTCRHLDMSATSEKQPPLEGDSQNREDLVELIVKQLVDCMIETKENIDVDVAASYCNGQLAMDPIKLFSGIVSSCLGEELQKKFPKLPLLLKDLTNERSNLHSTSDLSKPECYKYFRASENKGSRYNQHRLRMQEKELEELKDLMLKTKKELEEFQSQLQSDLNNLGSHVQKMSFDALRYHKLVKENRDLYNTVQDLKGNIRVYCRIRPCLNGESSNVIDFIGEDGSLVMSDPLKTQKDGRKAFHFNRVFGPTASQADIFEEIQPLIRSVMDGYNVCIFAYGQTGSGKTYTMSGPSAGSFRDVGINYLALNYLFQISSQRKETIKYEIYIQMVEIYNEQVRDLLSEEAVIKYPFPYEIRSCNENGLNLPDATLQPVKSSTDVLSLMKLGEVNRAVSSTALNNRSSRSHSVLTVHVHCKDKSGSTTRNCLHLVDLAGSERVDKSQVTGERLKETQYINKSLACLGDVITALAQKNSYIPFRNSKLTLLLQDSLGGHAKTLMFAHVSPEEVSFGETVSTLKFAQRASTVELGVARVNKQSSEVMQLKGEIEKLKKQLADKEAQRTPYQKLNVVPEKTPLSSRRLSIENSGITMTDRFMNGEDGNDKKSPCTIPTRPRRLSLEGAKSAKKDKLKQNVSVAMQDIEATSRLYGHYSNGNSELHANAPRSPTNFIYPKRLQKIDGSTQIASLKLLHTPINGAKRAPKGDLAHSTDCETTPNVISTGTNGKGSQIRKSLRTIGKFITGPEKRNQQNLVEARSPPPIKGSHINDGKSPATGTARPNRRQSLTGIQTSGSRRSSLGGKSTFSNENDIRSVRTPPPVSSASKTKRWV